MSKSIKEFLHVLKVCKDSKRISIQQYRTLRGQVISGNLLGAKKGLQKIMKGI